MLLIEPQFSQWSERCGHICQLEFQWWDHIGTELFQGWWMQSLRVDTGWRTWSTWEYSIQAQTWQCYGCAFARDFMIRPKNLKNVLYLWLSIIIRSDVYICQSSNAKNLCNVVWIDGELFSVYPTLQFNPSMSSIWLELFDQFINWVLKVLKQISPVFCFKDPRNKGSS